MTTASDFERAQTAVFDEVGFTPESQFVEIDQPQTSVHLISNNDENVDDVPVLFLHSGGTFGALFAPLMANLEETWTLAIDRPGFSLSGDSNTHQPHTEKP